ncbi:hypothetical protein [Niabella beijingensis]|uniref:hypothetical protein n=1 Tax=Niabella beijingensis TaxID=2872700 RepID=UPI001CBC3955|nr:hypothetical protein [Niabella beijingensis]MBZ4187610.1 hypothetical protein [Niabella beijingensis]
MKIFFSTIIACITVFIFSTGCKKNENTQRVSVAAENEPANLMNPYDSFGYWHNVILDSIDKQRTTGNCTGFSASCNYIRKFYDMHKWQDLTPDHFDQIPQNVMDAATDVNGYIDRYQWSDSVKKRLSQLVKIIEDVSADSCTYPEFKGAIRCFEESVIKSSLPVGDREVILKATSIARYSGFRWIQQPELKQSYDPNELPRLFQRAGFAPGMVKVQVRPLSIFKKVAKWVATTMIDIQCAIGELSIATGSEASDFFRELMK